MRYIITRPGGETYRIAGDPQGGDDLDAVKARAQDLASQPENHIARLHGGAERERALLRTHPASAEAPGIHAR